MKNNPNNHQIDISIFRLLRKLIGGNLLFLFKYGVIETTNRNLLAAIHIVNPYKKYKYKTKNVEIASLLANYSIYINEYIDTKKFIKITDEKKLKDEHKASRELIKSIEKNLKQKKNTKVNDFLKEFRIFHKWVHSKKLDEWDIETIKENRELMNAFHTYAIYTLVLDLKGSEYKSAGKSIQQMKSKYRWMIENKPQTVHQSAMCIAWNLAMVGQILDDRFDKPIDEICELATFATILDRHYRKMYIKNKGESYEINKIVENNVRNKLGEFKREYYKNAKELGYKPMIFQDIILNPLYVFLKAGMKYASRFPKPIKTVLYKRIRFLRDRWRAMGKFD
ncbi:MAG: hypothetical protein PHS44_02060 [Candidatus Dojkabacteria bacterium]|nr:hypothetical protein [Candidatus Dojkabacteria bacterium]